MSIEITVAVIELTREFPNSSRFELTSQINRSVISIPSNIAEGSSRSSQVDFAKFIEYSLGSAFELETQLIIAKDTHHATPTEINEIISELHYLQRMLSNFKRTLV